MEPDTPSAAVSRTAARIALRLSALVRRSPCSAFSPSDQTKASCQSPLRTSQSIAARFAETLAEWDGGKNFAAVRAAWLAHAGPVGERIRVQSAASTREGAFEGLDADGRLLFRGADGVETVEAADLWILPAPDGPPLAASSASLAREGRA